MIKPLIRILPSSFFMDLEAGFVGLDVGEGVDVVDFVGVVRLSAVGCRECGGRVLHTLCHICS